MALSPEKESLDVRVDELSKLVEEQGRFIEAQKKRMDGAGGSDVSRSLRAKKLPDITSRRDLLRRAGVAAGAASGLALLSQHTASAATGGNFILGQANDAGATTQLHATNATFPQPLLKGVGVNVGVALQGNATGSSSISIGMAVLGIAGTGAYGVVGEAANAPSLAAFGQGRIQQSAGVEGPPAFGSFNAEQTRDVQGTLWLSDTAGGWNPAALGGLDKALFTSVITAQPTLGGNNGTSWVPMAGGPTLTFTPKFHCQALVSVNVDLWTDTAGINQDVGIGVSGGAGTGVGHYPSTAAQPEAWKESGGFAGTFSPNAASVETVLPMQAGQAYTISVLWKANKPQPAGAKIWAGAGPIGIKYSPTRLTALLLPDSHSNVGVAFASPVAPSSKFRNKGRGNRKKA